MHGDRSETIERANEADAHRFLAPLCDRARRSGNVRLLRAVARDGRVRSLETASVDRAVLFANAAACAGMNVYCGVLPRVPLGSSEVAEFDALWVDLDCGDGHISVGYDTKDDALDALVRVSAHRDHPFRSIVITRFAAS